MDELPGKRGMKNLALVYLFRRKHSWIRWVRPFTFLQLPLKGPKRKRIVSLVRITSILWMGWNQSSTLFAKPTCPDLFSVAAGCFDVYRAKHQTFEFAIEYKFHLNCLKPPNRYVEFRPLVGLMATAQGSVYGYMGLNFDLLLFDHIHFAPGFAAGYFSSGSGKDLGYPLEFRSGVELGWQFDDWRRIGIHFYHLSNASLGRRNPGEESLVLFYDIPLVKGFPFIKEK